MREHPQHSVISERGASANFSSMKRRAMSDRFGRGPLEMEDVGNSGDRRHADVVRRKGSIWQPTPLSAFRSISLRSMGLRMHRCPFTRAEQMIGQANNKAQSRVGQRRLADGSGSRGARRSVASVACPATVHAGFPAVPAGPSVGSATSFVRRRRRSVSDRPRTRVSRCVYARRRCRTLRGDFISPALARMLVVPRTDEAR